MRRRSFIALLGGAATWPLASPAQQPARTKRIALVAATAKIESMTASDNRNYRVFFEELCHLGYVEGQNLSVARYSGEGGLTIMPTRSARSASIPI
jgi:putative ABC transport system substrate-binding protein